MLSNPVLPSTFLLTLLLMVGLFFFIRAATKDRTETIQLTAAQPPETLSPALETYFAERSYGITQVHPGSGQVTLSGYVRPSWFLAIFLSFLAGTGGLCFALVLATLFPAYGLAFSALLLIAPGAGIFYWRRAGREEQVTYVLSAKTDSPGTSSLTVTAHRDEVIALRQAFGSRLTA